MNDGGILLVLIPFAAAALQLLGKSLPSSRFPRLLLITRLVSLFAVLACLLLLGLRFPGTAAGGSERSMVGGWGLPVGIALHLDGLAWIGSLLVMIVSFASLLFAWPDPECDERFHFLFMLMIAGMEGALLADDLFNLFVFLEIFGMASYILIAWHRDGESSLAGFRYLLLSSAAIMLYLIGVLVIYRSAGTFSMEMLADDLGRRATVPPDIRFGGACLLVGVGIRTAFIPFHTWLPDAHASAPHPVSAVLSGVMIKVSLIAVWRILDSIGDPLLIRSFLWIGIGTAFAAVWLALAQSDAKRMLAYSSVSQMGYLLAAFGAGGALARTAVLAHMAGHALFKSLLFLSVGAVIDATGERNLSRMGGLGRKLPFAAIPFGVAALALAGIPPLNGFVGKKLVLESLKGFQAGYVLLLVTGIGTAAVAARLSGIFLGGHGALPPGVREPRPIPVLRSVSLVPAGRVLHRVGTGAGGSAGRDRIADGRAGTDRAPGGLRVERRSDRTGDGRRRDPALPGCGEPDGRHRRRVPAQEQSGTERFAPAVRGGLHGLFRARAPGGRLTMGTGSVMLLIVLPFTASALSLLEKAVGRRVRGAIFPAISLAVPVVCVGILLSVMPEVLRGEAIEYAVGGWGLPVGIALRLDGLAWIGSLLVMIVSFASLLFAWPDARTDGAFRFFFMVSLAGMEGVMLTDDLFNMFVFLEIIGLSVYVLIAWGRKPEAVLASFRYLILGSLGMLFFLLGVFIIYRRFGSFSMSALSDVLGREAAVPMEVRLAGAFLLAGIGIRTAFVPFHTWLPDAHGYAPHPVSAMLSGVMIKVSFIALWRILTAIGDPLLERMFLWIGAGTALYAVIRALAQSDAKKLLAYHSISQMGYILAGFGAAGNSRPGRLPLPRGRARAVQKPAVPLGGSGSGCRRRAGHLSPRGAGPETAPGRRPVRRRGPGDFRRSAPERVRQQETASGGALSRCVPAFPDPPDRDRNGRIVHETLRDLPAFPGRSAAVRSESRTCFVDQDRTSAAAGDALSSHGPFPGFLDIRAHRDRR